MARINKVSLNLTSCVQYVTVSLMYNVVQAGHLKEHWIDTIQPEEIRGGGLLKYARLLASGYKPLYPAKLARMERYMCSRFFIDFPDIDKQGLSLDKYVDF